MLGIMICRRRWYQTRSPDFVRSIGFKCSFTSYVARMDGLTNYYYTYPCLQLLLKCECGSYLGYYINIVVLLTRILRLLVYNYIATLFPLVSFSLQPKIVALFSIPLKSENTRPSHRTRM